MYISDVQTSIKALVQTMIDEGLGSNDQTDVDTAKARRRSLRIWLRAECPLGYGDLIYPALLRAITPYGEPPSMPLGNKESMSTREVAHLFYCMSREDKPIPLQAPFFTKAPHPGVFRVAVEYMHTQAAVGNIPDAPSFIKSSFAQILEDRDVAHVPWSAPPPPNAGAGRPGRKVNFVYWRSTGKDVEMGQRAIMQVVDAQDHARLTDVRLAREASLHNATAPWTLHNLSIGQLPSIMHKRRLPSDFKISDATLAADAGYVTKTYEWLMTHYDGASPLHRFALLVAHMFSRMTPYLKHPDIPASLVGARPSPSAITAEVRRAAWVIDTGRGVTAKEPFIVMVTTFIVAMAVDTSPLRKHLDANEQNFGVWAKKHGARNSYRLSITHSIVNAPLPTAKKRIAAFNFVRMGLADAHSASIYNAPKHGPSLAWTMKPACELMGLANKFLALLAEKPYGPYKAAQLIFGTASADRLAADSFSGVAQFLAPPPPQLPPSSGRRRQDDREDDDDAGASPPPAQKRSRVR